MALSTNGERPWHARWIWSDDDGTAPNVWRWFRHEFVAAADSLDAATGSTALLRITAESRYRVWINGHRIGDGPPLSVPWRQYYDEYDVSADLRDGRNCVAVLVNSLGRFPTQTRGGLLAEISSGDVILTGTDTSWRVSRATSFMEHTSLFPPNKLRPYAVVEDTRREPAGWREVGFDDASWPPASAVHDDDAWPGAALPWTTLVRRDIPDCDGETITPTAVQVIEECVDLEHRAGPGDLAPGLSQVGNPVRNAMVEDVERLVTVGGGARLRCSTNHLDMVSDGIYDPCLTLDFGEVRTARVAFDVQAPAGAVIEVGYAERLIDGHFNISIEGPFAERFVLRGGQQQVSSHHWHAFRYLRIRVRHCLAPLEIRRVDVRLVRYPFTEWADFRCADPTLEKVFRISRATLRLCSVDSIMDTPWRESAQWVGDTSAVTIGGIYACFGDTALPAKFLRQSGACQLPHGLLAGFTNVPDLRAQHAFADFSLWWVQALWNHYRYTGDESWLHEYYGNVLRVVQAFEEHTNPDGLVTDMGIPIFVDWAPVDRRGANAAVNALFAETLRVVARMAQIKGDDWTSRKLTTLRDRIAACFQRTFYDPERGVVCDAVDNGVRSTVVSEQANAAALLWGMLDGEAARQVIENLWAHPRLPRVEAQPFFTAVVLRALVAHQRADLALRIVRDRWGKRMVDRGATSTFEEWGTNGSWRDGQYLGFMRSLSHAWSAYPAEFLTRLLPGLEIAEPGCGRLRVAPRTVDLDYSTTWMTPRGPVRVTHRDGSLHLVVPEGVSVEAPRDAVVVVEATGEPERLADAP